MDDKTYAIVSNVRSGDTDHLVAAHADATRRTPPGSNMPHVVILGMDGKPLPGQHAASEEEFRAGGEAVSGALKNAIIDDLNKPPGQNCFGPDPARGLYNRICR